MGKMFAQLFSSFQIMFLAWELLMKLVLNLAQWGEGKARTARIEGELEDAEQLDLLAERIAARKATALAAPVVIPTTTV